MGGEGGAEQSERRLSPAPPGRHHGKSLSRARSAGPAAHELRGYSARLCPFAALFLRGTILSGGCARLKTRQWGGGNRAGMSSRWDGAATPFSLPVSHALFVFGRGFSTRVPLSRSAVLLGLRVASALQHCLAWGRQTTKALGRILSLSAVHALV